MSPPISGHTETLLPNGKVLIAGGLNNYHFFFGSRLYDSSTSGVRVVELGSIALKI